MSSQLRSRKCLLIAVIWVLLAVALIAPGRLPAALGQTVPPPPGTFLSFVSQPGDPIGFGQTLTFTPANAGFFANVSQDQREFHATVFPPGSFWFLDLAAPAGQQLVPGAYEGATRYPFQGPAVPGLNFVGDGRGCNTSTGRFQVLEASYGPQGYFTRFHATFEQHCEGLPAALFGEIQIVNPPPVTITLAVDGKGSVQRVAGTATVSGTITCSRAATVNLLGTLRQRAGRNGLSTGSASASVACSTASAPWSLTVSAASGPPFNAGRAALDLSASDLDPATGFTFTAQTSATVQLTGSGH